MEELATQNGTTTDAVKTAIFDARVDAINQAVADGDLPQEKADWMVERMETRQLMSQIIDKDVVIEALAKTAGLTVEEWQTAREDGTLRAKVQESGVTLRRASQSETNRNRRHDRPSSCRWHYHPRTSRHDERENESWQAQRLPTT